MNDETNCLDLHGYGILVYEDGSTILEGYFVNGLMNGKCREITSLYMFEGNMSDGLKHGEGKLVDERSIFEGMWE